MKPASELLPPLIILAGGKSERFGSPKGLAKVGEQTLLAAHIASYLDAGTSVVVVLGHYTDPYIREIEAIKKSLDDGLANKIRYTINVDPGRGPFSSLQSGLFCPGISLYSGVFVQPVDSGVIPAELFRMLFHASETASMSVIPEYEGRGGHPVFLGPSLTARLPLIDPLAPEGRLDYQLHAENQELVRRLAVDFPSILTNMNVGKA